MLHQLRSATPLLSNKSDVEIFEFLSRGAHSASISSSSRDTYHSGVRRFLSYLELTGQSLNTLMTSNGFTSQMLPYSAYLFIVENLAVGTIRTYIAALQYFLFSNDFITSSVWSPRLNQSIKAYVLQESRERPLSKKI